MYYTRDTAKVIAMVQGTTESPPCRQPFPQAERLESLVQERRRLQSRQATLLAQRRSPTAEVAPAAYVAPAPGPSIDQELGVIQGELRILDNEEQALQAEAFRDSSLQAFAGTLQDAAESDSPRAADRVRITVAGQGQLHLRGPLDGINAITRMIHEIDQPVGQVKLGIHVVQFTSSENDALLGVDAVMDRSLGHAKQMSQLSQALFRTALRNVAAKYQSSDPNRFEEAFFHGPCVRNFRMLNGPQARLSIPLLDSRDIVTTLSLTGLCDVTAGPVVGNNTERAKRIDASCPT